MKDKELTNRYLVLLKIDATNLFERIDSRHKEFMDDFSLKRDRAIFDEVFYSRYKGLSMEELSYFSTEVIELANQYYQKIEKLHWYLLQTQDMPTTIEDEVIRYCSNLKILVNNLNLYIDAELGGKSDLAQEVAVEQAAPIIEESWSEESDF